ncbi:MAG: hypothetical protein VKK07_06505 [Merismopediaceae bacterium]|nr:hypothetical protein [Merismopediaceae bacterium]
MVQARNVKLCISHYSEVGERMQSRGTGRGWGSLTEAVSLWGEDALRQH